MSTKDITVVLDEGEVDALLDLLWTEGQTSKRVLQPSQRRRLKTLPDKLRRAWADCDEKEAKPFFRITGTITEVE